MTDDEKKAAAVLDLLGKKLFIAVAGDNARISAALTVAKVLMNTQVDHRKIAQAWFSAPCGELNEETPIEALATCTIEDLERITAVLVVVARGF